MVARQTIDSDSVQAAEIARQIMMSNEQSNMTVTEEASLIRFAKLEESQVEVQLNQHCKVAPAKE